MENGNKQHKISFFLFLESEIKLKGLVCIKSYGYWKWNIDLLTSAKLWEPANYKLLWCNATVRAAQKKASCAFHPVDNDDNEDDDDDNDDKLFLWDGWPTKNQQSSFQKEISSLILFIVT